MGLVTTVKIAHEYFDTFVAVTVMISKFFFEWPKHVGVKRPQIGTVGSMFQYFQLILSNCKNCTLNRHVSPFSLIAQLHHDSSTQHSLYAVHGKN